MKLSNKVYDILTMLVMIAIPAVAGFYGSLAELWNLPFPDKIPQTLMIFAAMLGAFLKDSSAKYYKNLADEKAKEAVADVVDVEDIDHQVGAENGDSDKG